MLAGPAGTLEAIVDTTAGPVGALAVVCHPHPLHQGNMSNKVTHMLARWFARQGAAAVRFNFRGVGRSEGSFGGGDGETDDAGAVVQWAMTRWPGAPVYLAGFSFGAMVAVRCAAARDVAGLVTVAPAIRLLPERFAQPRCRWLVIQGLDDDIVAAADVRAWCERLEPSPLFHGVPGVGHFFHGALGEIVVAMDAFFGAPAAAGGLREQPVATC